MHYKPNYIFHICLSHKMCPCKFTWSDRRGEGRILPWKNLHNTFYPLWYVTCKHTPAEFTKGGTLNCMFFVKLEEFAKNILLEMCKEASSFLDNELQNTYFQDESWAPTQCCTSPTQDEFTLVTETILANHNCIVVSRWTLSIKTPSFWSGSPLLPTVRLTCA